MLTVRQQQIIATIQQFYATHGRAPVASELNIKTSIKRTFGSWNNALDVAGIPTDSRQRFDTRFTTTKTCILCNTDISNTRARKYCDTCAAISVHSNSSKAQKIRGLKRKLAAIQARGGSCEKCGYNANLAALEFHHVHKKSFGLDMRSFSNRSDASLQAELSKCVVLCSNCHAELHNPDLCLTALLTIPF